MECLDPCWGSFSHIPLWPLLPLPPHTRFDFLSATVGHGKDSSLLLLEPLAISESLQGVNTPSSPLLYLNQRWACAGSSQPLPKSILSTNSLTTAISLCSLCLLTTQHTDWWKQKFPKLTISCHSRVFHLLSELQIAVLETLLVWLGGARERRGKLGTAETLRLKISTSDCKTTVNKVMCAEITRRESCKLRYRSGKYYIFWWVTRPLPWIKIFTEIQHLSEKTFMGKWWAICPWFC